MSDTVTLQDICFTYQIVQKVTQSKSVTESVTPSRPVPLPKIIKSELYD